MNKVDIADLFKKISQLDQTLSLDGVGIDLLQKKYLTSEKYNDKKFYRNMYMGRISLFNDHFSPYVGKGNIINALSEINFDERFRAKFGGVLPEIHYLALNEIIEKWSDNEEVMSITDLHIRNTPIENLFNLDQLSKHNLYLECPSEVGSLEMMTILISTQFNVTESHCDDSDGSNHCLVGKKLWLCWDTLEGLKNGIEDIERLDIDRQCHFDLATFVTLKSSSWFFVGEGDTLFLPGNLSHKVITLEKYIGIGSFYISLLNFLRTLSWWKLHKPNWELNEPPDINKHNYDQLQSTISSISFDNNPDNYIAKSLKNSIDYWHEEFSSKDRSLLLSEPMFNHCYQCLLALANNRH